MELKDTINLMNSSDYKDRFRAEYYQTKIRHDKLCDMLLKETKGELNFVPTCPIETLVSQKHIMGEYLHCLELRAEIEEIKL